MPNLFELPPDALEALGPPDPQFLPEDQDLIPRPATMDAASLDRMVMNSPVPIDATGSGGVASEMDMADQMADQGTPMQSQSPPSKRGIIATLPPPPQTQEEWTALAEWQKEAYRRMRQGIQYTPEALATFAGDFMEEDRRAASERAATETPKAGKMLTDSATQKLNQIMMVKKSLPRVRAAYAKIADRMTTGPIGGRIPAGQEIYNPDYASLNSEIDQLIPVLARGVFGEVGVLTDTDVERYRALLPNATTSPNISGALFDALENKLETAAATTFDTFDRAGYDVSGFTDLAGAGSPGATAAQTPAAAAAAGRGVPYRVTAGATAAQTPAAAAATPQPERKTLRGVTYERTPEGNWRKVQ